MYSEKGSCWDGVPEKSYVRWEEFVKPGDKVTGTEWFHVTSMENPDPWEFCYGLDRMRPVWQPEYLPTGVQHWCASLYGKNQTGTSAVLSREGFHRADTFYGVDRPENWIPFVYWGSIRESEVTHTWPAHTWVPVEGDQIYLDKQDVYVVSNTEAYGLIISYAGGTSFGERTDIEWYSVGTPIVFVKKANASDYGFSWTEDTVMFRVRLEGDTPIIEQAVWE
jgi:hypothetical protein